MEREILATCFGLIAAVTLVGNILVVIVLVSKSEWLKRLHTRLLLALAVQDILTATCLLVLPHFVLPSDAYELPSNNACRLLYCSIIWSQYIPFSLSIVSIYTCLMLAVDRWVAVLRPLTYRRFSSSSKCAITMVSLPWIAGFAFEIGTALNVESLKQENGTYVCKTTKHPDLPTSTVMVLFLLLGKGLLPEILMVVGYAKMVARLMKTSARAAQEGNVLNHERTNSISTRNSQSASQASLKRLTRMVCAVSAIVIICWLPDQFYHGLAELNLINIDDSIHNGLHVLAFLNICLNPFLYNFFNKQYKREFKKIFSCLLKRDAQLSSSEPACHSLKKTCSHN